MNLLNDCLQNLTFGVLTVIGIVDGRRRVSGLKWVTRIMGASKRRCSHARSARTSSSVTMRKRRIGNFIGWSVRVVNPGLDLPARRRRTRRGNAPRPGGPPHDLHRNWRLWNHSDNKCFSKNMFLSNVSDCLHLIAAEGHPLPLRRRRLYSRFDNPLRHRKTASRHGRNELLVSTGRKRPRARKSNNYLLAFIGVL
jgi:hypothetical protein